MKNHGPVVCCRPFHVFQVYLQGPTSLKQNQYTRILFIQASEHPSCGTTKSSSGLSMLLSEEPHAINVLPSIVHLLWVHMQDLKILNHNQYTGMMSIQTTEHPSSGTRFSRNWKIMMLSLGWCMLLHEELQAMNVWPPIPYVLWVKTKKLKEQVVE